MNKLLFTHEAHVCLGCVTMDPSLVRRFHLNLRFFPFADEVFVAARAQEVGELRVLVLDHSPQPAYGGGGFYRERVIQTVRKVLSLVVPIYCSFANLVQVQAELSQKGFTLCGVALRLPSASRSICVSVNPSSAQPSSRKGWSNTLYVNSKKKDGEESLIVTAGPRKRVRRAMPEAV